MIKFLREVKNETTAVGVWLKLEQIYMTKNLTSRIYLKGKLYGFKIQEDKSMDDNLDEFNKIIIDLKNIGIKIEDEDQAMIILSSLPNGTFMESMKYALVSLTLEEVQVALKSNDIENKVD